jgi:hypothetical protein
MATELTLNLHSRSIRGAKSSSQASHHRSHNLSQPLCLTQLLNFFKAAPSTSKRRRWCGLLMLYYCYPSPSLFRAMMQPRIASPSSVCPRCRYLRCVTRSNTMFQALVLVAPQQHIISHNTLHPRTSARISLSSSAIAMLVAAPQL